MVKNFEKSLGMTSFKKNHSFSHWHIQLIRARLKAYKLNEACRGWIDVAENIIYSEMNVFDFPKTSEEEDQKIDEQYRIDLNGYEKNIKNDAKWPIQAQDLGRFVDGRTNRKTGGRSYTVPNLDKINAFYSFLVEKVYLSENFLEINPATVDYNAAYALSDYFESYDNEPSFISKYEFIGDYGFILRNEDQTNLYLLTILPSVDNIFYYVAKTVNVQNNRIKAKKRKYNIYGWAITNSNDNCIFFFKSNDESNIKENNRNNLLETYSLENIVTNSDQNQIMKLVFRAHNSITISNDIEFWGREERIIRDNLVVYDKLYDIPSNLKGEKEKRPLSFQSTGISLDKWKEFQHKDEKVKAEKVVRLSDHKSDKVDDLTINDRFLGAAHRADDVQVRVFLNSGDVDINYQDPKSKCSALHLAAVFAATAVLKELIKEPDLQYLVFSATGKLPSQFAWENDEPGMATFLQKKEIAEAEAKGLDYKELLAKADHSVQP